MHKKLVYDLFSGTTCYHHISIYEIIGDFIIVHHKSHSEYLNRFSGSCTCKTWYCLVKLGMENKSSHFWVEKESLLYIEGRMNKQKHTLFYDTINQLKGIV